MSEEFGQGISVFAQTFAFRVQGEGKFAVMWAKDKNHAKQRFSAEFFPGFKADTVEALD